MIKRENLGDVYKTLSLCSFCMKNKLKNIRNKMQ